MPGGPETIELYRAAVLPTAYEGVGDNSVVPINPFELTSGLHYDSPKGGVRWNLVNELFGKLLIDPHPELVEAWEAILELPVDSTKRTEAMKEFVRLPLTEEEADEVNRTQFGDSGLRNKLGSEWLSFARKKYSRAKQIASE